MNCTTFGYNANKGATSILRGNGLTPSLACNTTLPIAIPANCFLDATLMVFSTDAAVTSARISKSSMFSLQILANIPPNG